MFMASAPPNSRAARQRGSFTSCPGPASGAATAARDRRYHQRLRIISPFTPFHSRG